MDIRYLAGFIDGEGTIAIYGKLSIKYRTHTVALRVGNLDRRPLDFLQSQYGGWVGVQKGNGVRRDTFAYYVTGKRAYQIIQDLYPYLIIKKPQATLVVENWNVLQPRRGGFTKWLTEDIKEKRNEIYLKMKLLNQRGLTIA